MNLPVIYPQWPAPESVYAFTTTRAGGISGSPWKSLNMGLSCGDKRLNVLKNREIVAKMIPASPVWLSQTHGNTVVRQDANSLAGVEADAATTQVANCVCAVLTADCLPVLFSNKSGTEVAAAHAGWKGLAAGILENTVNCMNTRPSDILAWIGPGIGPSVYQVGAELRDVFCSDDPLAKAAFQISGDGWKANLPMLARQRLARCGVNQVFGGTECTYSDPDRFFSYRRDGRTGRMATMIWFQ